MVDDVERVRDWACQQADVEQVVYFGSRFGALVAAAAGRAARSPLACWNAPATGAAYFSEIFRILRVGRLAGAGMVDEMPAPKDLLRSGQPLDVLGYTLGPALYLSASTLAFADELGPRTRMVKLATATECCGSTIAESARARASSGRTLSVIPIPPMWWAQSNVWPPGVEMISWWSAAVTARAAMHTLADDPRVRSMVLMAPPLGDEGRGDIGDSCDVGALFLKHAETLRVRKIPTLFIYGAEDSYYHDFQRARHTRLEVLFSDDSALAIEVFPGELHGLSWVGSQERFVRTTLDWISQLTADQGS
ncbi:MAG TPA: hypothetical protein VMD08_15070 [Candidatus Baltobacteraceae bacterium]|nr:hypothetical protein [Candidatus Baltobacteraceae bacterium]